MLFLWIGKARTYHINTHQMLTTVNISFKNYFLLKNKIFFGRSKYYHNSFPLFPTFHLSKLEFLGSGDFSTLPPFQETSVPLGAIIGAIVAILLLGFILVDLTCFKINQTGITYMVCRRARKKAARANKSKRQK